MNPKIPGLSILLLAGGKSSRMGREKATLEYQGKTQLERMAGLVTPLGHPVYLSARKDQCLPGFGIQPIFDTEGLEGKGPIAGMLSAFGRNPDMAFLVIACDLPFLERKTLEFLLENRSPRHIATAYRSAHGGLPEPLCAIWEPCSSNILKDRMAEDIRCPRKILIQENTHLIDLPNPTALDNINTPEEYEAALASLKT